MKYYIPTSSLNFNNILSTESLSPKSFYERRGFGYSRWFSVEENSIDYLTLLYDKPHLFERPKSDFEDHPMLIEIDVDDEFSKVTDGVFYTDRTIYLNPWQTKFFFFTEKDKTTAMSLSDSSLETKLIRLYKKNIYVHHFDGTYPILQKDNIVPIGDIDCLVEEDYVINKMKGLLYGYYIGANLSSTKENVQKLDALREIQNIFSSVLSSYDKTPSNVQQSRLDELFDYLDSQQPIYADFEKEFGDRQLVNRIFAILKRHGYVFTFIDRKKIIFGLQDDSENNQSITWINREITHVKSLMESTKVKLYPDVAEIIVSSKDKVTVLKAIEDNLMSKLFVCWVNEVLCSKSFNGNINSIKEELSDEITKTARNVIGLGWENSPVRTYLNQLRRHVRGEEFNQSWDNGVLSSISAVLIKGDDWEKLLNFMQSKGMYDYRIAFALYGVLNGFANLTRDFTDILLNQENAYVADIYSEFYGQLHGITINKMSKIEVPKEKHIKEHHDVQVSMHKEYDDNNDLIKEIWNFFDNSPAIPKSGKKRKNLEEGLSRCLKDYTGEVNLARFIMDLNDYDEYGWKKSNKPWKSMQERFFPDYNVRFGQKKSISGNAKESPSLFDEIKEDIQQTTQTAVNYFAGNTVQTMNIEQNNSKQVSTPVNIPLFVSDRKCWDLLQDIVPISFRHEFYKDLKWFQDEYAKGEQSKYYAHASRENNPAIEAFLRYIKKKDYANSLDMNKISEQLHKIYV